MNQTPADPSPSDSSRRNPAENLTREDRVRGGELSSSTQHRDQRGQFAGRKSVTPAKS